MQLLISQSVITVMNAMKPGALAIRDAKSVRYSQRPPLVHLTVDRQLVNTAIKMELSEICFIEDALTVRVSRLLLGNKWHRIL